MMVPVKKEGWISIYTDSSKPGRTCSSIYATKEEAESMARKIKAVLNGAEVIEMPSEEEFEMIAELEYPTGTDELLLVNGIKLAQAAFNAGIKWLKSKIK